MWGLAGPIGLTPSPKAVTLHQAISADFEAMMGEGDGQPTKQSAS